MRMMLQCRVWLSRWGAGVAGLRFCISKHLPKPLAKRLVHRPQYEEWSHASHEGANHVLEYKRRRRNKGQRESNQAMKEPGGGLGFQTESEQPVTYHTRQEPLNRTWGDMRGLWVAASKVHTTKTRGLTDTSSHGSEHEFRFSSQKDRDFHSLMISQVMRKKPRKCDINGHQEALVFKDKKNPLLQGDCGGGGEAFQISRHGNSKWWGRIFLLKWVSWWTIQVCL